MTVLAYTVWLGLWLVFVVVFAEITAVNLWDSTVRPWWVRLRKANAYASRHRQGSIPPYIHWATQFAGRVMHEIAVRAVINPENEVPLDDTQWDLPPVVDGPDVTRYDRAIGSAHYLRLQPGQLDLTAELVLTRTEIPALRPVIFADISDEMYAEAMAG